MSHKPAILFVALLLGLGWAVRGHFGHEWGAAWSGGMSGIALVAASGRRDWNRRLGGIAALAAVGWATGGMMSYGLVVGFGRDTGLLNVWYGLTMLGIIGGLYGFIGGGLLGLDLETTREKRPEWASVVTQMVAAGYLFWAILIYQFEWKMTPPRSELWAACLGASVALGWYQWRRGFRRALGVAGWSALGAGLGFSLGNFFQTLGVVSGAAFNWWNVMEFTLGFCGGLGMAYGVLTRDWPEAATPSRPAQILGLWLLLAVIPFVNVTNAFEISRLVEEAKRATLSNPDAYAKNTILLASVTGLVFSTLAFMVWNRWRSAAALVFLYPAYYVVFGHIRKGVFAGIGARQLEQYLYWVVLAAAAGIWFLARGRDRTPFLIKASETGRIWILRIGLALILILILAWISTRIHSGLPGAQQRFAESKAVQRIKGFRPVPSAFAT